MMSLARNSEHVEQYLLSDHTLISLSMQCLAEVTFLASALRWGLMYLA